MQIVDTNAKNELLRRLKRIEGQVRGVSRMIEAERDCREVLQQLAAVRSAVHQANMLVVRSYASQCLLTLPESSGRERDAVLNDLISVLSKAV